MGKLVFLVLFICVFNISFGQNYSDTLKLVFPDNTDLFEVVEFSNNGELLACITESHRNNINVYDVKTQKLLFILSENISFINSIGFSENDELLFTSSFDSIVRIYDLKNARQVAQNKIPIGEMGKISFLSNSEIVFTTNSNQIGLWNFLSGGFLTRNIGLESETIDLNFVLSKSKSSAFIKSNSKVYSFKIIREGTSFVDVSLDKDFDINMDSLFNLISLKNKDITECKIEISQFGHMIVVKLKDGTVYSIQEQNLRYILQEMPYKIVSDDFLISPQANFLITIEDNKLKVFDLISFQVNSIPDKLNSLNIDFEDIEFVSDDPNLMLIKNNYQITNLTYSDILVYNILTNEILSIYSQQEYVGEIDGSNGKIVAVTRKNDEDSKLDFYSLKREERLTKPKILSLYTIEESMQNPFEFKFAFPYSKKMNYSETYLNISNLELSEFPESLNFGYNSQENIKDDKILFYGGDEYFSICKQKRVGKSRNVGVCTVINSGFNMGIEGLNYSPNYKFIAATSFDRMVKIFNSKGEHLSDFKLHSKPVISSAFSSDSRFLISKGRDNVLGVWSVENRKLLYFIIFYENGDRLIKLADSPYYMCSKDASKMLHYVTPSLKVIGFEQLDPVYNRPDIVLDSIGKYFGNEDRGMIDEYRKSWEKRIDRLGLDKEKLGKGEIAVPSAEIIGADEIAYENKVGKVEIKVEANDSKYTLRRFNVYVNEVPLYGSLGISISQLQAHKWDTTLTVPLSFGENKIQVSVMNDLGLENFKYPTYVNYIPVNDAVVAKTHYIGIGVNSFINKQYNLTYCVKDVNDLASALGGENTRVKILTDQQVTRENILQLKQYLKDSTTVNDKVIISCSSHGLLDDSLNFYLATHDVDFKHPELRGLRYEELESLLDGIPARQKLLLLDACNSGENDKTELLTNELAQKESKMNGSEVLAARGVIIQLEEENKNNFKKMNELFVNVRNNTGSVIISAAGGQESALEAIEIDGKKIENGAFTYSVLEYLKSNEGDQEALTVNKLKQYVENRVEELTEGKQKPTSRQETMEVDWRVR